MIETLLTTVLSSTLLLSTPKSSHQPQTPHITFTRVLPQKNFVSYVAGVNENLGDVALKYYGSADYWTNLWNDNPLIEDPDDIAGKTIEIDVNKTSQSEDLTPNLAKRQEEINHKKNQEYLEKIGYLPPVTPQPQPSLTVTPDAGSSGQVVVSFTQTINPLPTITPIQPTQAVTPSSETSSTISDAAITYLGNCEAGMNPTKNTGNGYYGAFQFSSGTWNRLNTGYARADLAPIEVQEAAVKQLLQSSNIYSQFPSCAHKMRSAGLI